MKNIILIFAVLMFFSLETKAQNNTLPTTGNVGIGTTNPATNLHVQRAYNRYDPLRGQMAKFDMNDAPGDALYITDFAGRHRSGIFAPAIWGYRATSTIGPAISILGTVKNTIDVANVGAIVTFQARQGVSPGNHGRVQNRNLFSWSNYDKGVMLIDVDGKVGIGTTAPDDLLTVKGKIHAQEIRVDLLGAVAPDYVFQKYYEGSSDLQPEYELNTLEEVEAYTRENHHLPGMPSAAEFEEKGYDLGEMNRILLEKVEELTLHLIEQNKINKQQQERITALEKAIK